jgi:hypothetical protein
MRVTVARVLDDEEAPPREPLQLLENVLRLQPEQLPVRMG